MFVTRYCKRTMVYKLYMAWIKIGRWEDVDERLEKAFEDGKITHSQLSHLMAHCMMERKKEYRQKKELAGKVGA